MSNYLKLKTEIDEKMCMQRASHVECQLAYSELILDMANEIESLKDELRRYTEEDWNKRAYGD